MSTKPDRKWEDSLRKKWTWDKIVKGTHAVDCMAVCNFDIYLKDGKIIREEQAANYPGVPGIPDPNPKGCQKGLVEHQQMQSPERLRHPLKRVGERGAGEWQEVSWDEALTEIADKLISTIIDDGPGAVSMRAGVGVLLEMMGTAAPCRVASLLGSSYPDCFESTSDLPSSESLTWGDYYYGHSSMDWYTHDYVIFWYFNPNVTRIPDAHYFWEAKYNGSEIVSITPEYNPSSISASLWVNPKYGTDGALALGMANVIIEENLHDVPYIKEQTDFPFLVRKDNNRYLRESDMEPQGREDMFYFWDMRRAKLAKTPGSLGDSEPSIALGDLDPALEGEYEVQTLDGPMVVRPVFVRLKEYLKDFTPEKAQAICGVHPDVIRKIARGFAAAERPMIIGGFGVYRWYNCDSTGRALIMLPALVGKITGENTGFTTWNGWAFEALEDGLYWPRREIPDDATEWELLHARKFYRERIESDTVWGWIYGNQGDAARKYYGDDLVGEIESRLKTALENKWQPHYGGKDDQLKAMIMVGDNYFGRIKNVSEFRDNLLKQLDLIVTLDIKMTGSGMYSDFVLPVATNYEKYSLRPNWLSTVLHMTQPAVEPEGESKSDWQVMAALMKKISEFAKARNIEPYNDEEFGNVIEFDKLYDQFVADGAFTEDKDVVQWILDNSKSTEGMKVEEMEEVGWGAFPHVDATKEFRWIGEKKPFLTPAERVGKKERWNTLAGRQQFYIEHEWFLEYGEELPNYKPSPMDTDTYPLVFNTSHARYSIHSNWTTNEQMLRLNRGEPFISINPQDAAERDIEDGDLVEVYNSVGSFKCQAKVRPGLPRGATHMYHGWDPLLFRDKASYQNAIPTLIKPTQLVSGYGHVEYGMWYWGPNQNSNDASVEVAKVERDSHAD